VEFDDLSELHGEPPPYLGEALALPVPPPPDAAGPAAPAPWDPLDAAQYLPPPPPPELGAPVEAAAAPVAAPAVEPSGLPGPLPQGLQAPPPLQSLPSTLAPPVPDAVTDATGMPAKGEVAGQPYAPSLTPEQRYAQTVAEYGDDPYSIPDIAEQQRYLNDLYLRDPVKAQDLEMKHEFARRDKFAADKARAERENYDREIQNLKDRDASRAKIQQQTDQIMAEAQRIAETKIDPTGGLSGGQKIAGVLSSIFGGLVQGRTGAARNAGLDSFEALVNRGIDVQKADLANRRNTLDFKRSALGEAYARTGDMFVAQEAVRQATYQHAINLIDSDAQNWDARGTQAMQRAKARAGLVTAQAKSLRDAQIQEHERDLKEREQRRKERADAAQEAHNRATIGIRLKELDESRRAREDAKRDKRDEKAAEAAAKQADIERKFSVGGEPKIAVGPDGKPVLGADGRPVITYDRVRDKNGNIWTPPDGMHQEIVKKTGTGRSLLGVYDRMIALRDRVGGEVDLFNSAESAELLSLEAEATALLKAGTEGMSSDDDMKLLKKAGGVDSVTSFREQMPKLVAARARVVKKLNDAYRAAGYDGQDLKFENPYTGASNTDQDDKLESVLRKPELSFNDVLAKELMERQIAAGRENGLDVTNNPSDQAIYREAYRAAQAKYHPDAAPHQQEHIAALAASAGGDDKAAQDARTDLQRIIAEAPTARLRDLARGALESALRASGSSEETSMSVAPIGGARVSAGAGPRSAATLIPDELTLRSPPAPVLPPPPPPGPAPRSEVVPVPDELRLR
jgi:hypothetical protein